MDKCPKCNDPVFLLDHEWRKYKCGSEVLANGEVVQSDLCRASCELSALQQHHQLLISAAEAVFNRFRDQQIVISKNIDVEIELEVIEDFETLEKELESNKQSEVRS